MRESALSLNGLIKLWEEMMILKNTLKIKTSTHLQSFCN